MVKLNVLDWVVVILLIVGGLNWGLIGLFGYDLVAAIFGGMMTAGARIIYVLVGLAAIYMIFLSPKLGKKA